MKFLACKSLLSLSLILLISANSWAQSLSAAEAAQMAEQRTGGKVLQVKTSDRGSYRVRVLLPNGQVKNLLIGNNEASGRDNDREQRKNNNPFYR